MKVENTKLRIGLIGITLVLILIGIFIYQYFKFYDGKLRIIFCDVGQGDGILVRTTNGQDILIDGGPDDSILSCLSRHTPFWDRDIELMILSHPHEDHMAGLLGVLKTYKVKSFATEGLINTTPVYKELKNTLKNKKIEERILYKGDIFRIKDLQIKVLGPSKELISKTPNGEISESTEDGSLMLLLSFGEFDTILTGDSPLSEAQESAGELDDIEVFQIPHHGSRFNTDENVLGEINPQIAIISVGKNKYGHPSKDIIKLLEELEIKTFRTDIYGDIEIISDRESFKVL